MKTGTLLQSVLLAAGLMAGGVPAAQSEQAFSIVPSSFIYNLLHDNYSPGLTPWRASSQYYPGSSNSCNQGNHGRGNGYGHEGHWQHGKYDGRCDGNDHKGHWQHGKYDGRCDGNDHKDHWQHGKYDGRNDRHDRKDHWKTGKYDGRDDRRDHKNHRQHGMHDGRDDAGRKGHRPGSAGIGYTGRS